MGTTNFSGATAPEECFNQKIDVSPVDMLHCTLTRARAILVMITTSGDDHEIGFRTNHTIM